MGFAKRGGRMVSVFDGFAKWTDHFLFLEGIGFELVMLAFF